MHYYRQDPTIERDPNITKMRLDVFEAMKTAIDTAFPEESQSAPQDEIKFVSFEDAVRELSEIKQGKFV